MRVEGLGLWLPQKLWNRKAPLPRLNGTFKGAFDGLPGLLAATSEGGIRHIGHRLLLSTVGMDSEGMLKRFLGEPGSLLIRHRQVFCVQAAKDAAAQLQDAAMVLRCCKALSRVDATGLAIRARILCVRLGGI